MMNTNFPVFFHKRFEETEEPKPEDAFREVITSCRSLSTYEPNNLRSALPQVIHTNII